MKSPPEPIITILMVKIMGIFPLLMIFSFYADEPSRTLIGIQVFLFIFKAK